MSRTPVLRARARQALAPAQPTADSFSNFTAKVGIGTRNQATAGGYTPNLVTRNRNLLEQGYRGSWVFAAAVDIPADDMTRAGIAYEGEVEGKQREALDAALRDMGLWQRFGEGFKWGRLYGGCALVIMIKGQNPATPLRLDSIRQGDFQGLLVLDRWRLFPVLGKVVTDFGPNFGLPETYETVADPTSGVQRMVIHHTRVLRFIGYDLPHWQAIQEQSWGESVIERIWDRVVAFDSVTAGAAQLAYKAHLRTIKVEGLREIISAGGKAMEGVAKQFEMIRLFQSNEGLTLLDGADEFETHAYGFTGLTDLINAYGEQLAGALEIPTIRLFGQSPSGMNATGESDLRTYYDGIVKKQEAQLRRPLTVVLDVLWRSLFGGRPPEGFSFRFNPLWQTSDKERAEIGKARTDAVLSAYSASLVEAPTALRELRHGATFTDLWSHITDEDIEEAEARPPQSEIAALEHEGRELGVEGQRKALEEPDTTGDADDE